MPAIEAHDLCKTYTSVKKAPGIWGSVKGLFSPERVRVEAVKNVNLSIEQGEIVGFLGPNGAGKTTTLKMMSGILFPTSGEARVLGFRPNDRKPEMLRQISLVMGNKMQLWWDLPASDSFAVLRELYEVDRKVYKQRLEYLLETLALTDKVNLQVRKMSLGERMKCELVAALLHSPRVLFLDEPTIGLDVVSQKRIRDFLKELHRQENCTIILTSHYMQDVQELCERVYVIDHGAKIFEGALDDLARQFSDTRRLRLRFASPVEVKALEAYGKVIEGDEEGVTLEVAQAKIASVTAEVLGAFPVNDVGIQEIDVEEVIRELFTKDRS